MMIKPKKGRILLLAATLWLVLVAFLLGTNPSRLPVSFVVTPYALFAAAAWVTWDAFCAQIFADRTRGRSVRRFGHVMALAATVCLALQSIGQLSYRDVAVVVLVCSLGFFYMHRMAGSVRNTTE